MNNIKLRIIIFKGGVINWLMMFLMMFLIITLSLAPGLKTLASGKD